MILERDKGMKPLKSIFSLCAGVWLLLFSAMPAEGLYITGDLEILRIPSVGAGWQVFWRGGIPWKNGELSDFMSSVQLIKMTGY